MDRELKHHGIKGQRWGVRRYQNSDGTLTPAGKVRYRNSSASLKKIASEMRERNKEASDFDRDRRLTIGWEYIDKLSKNKEIQRLGEEQKRFYKVDPKDKINWLKTTGKNEYDFDSVSKQTREAVKKLLGKAYDEPLTNIYRHEDDTGEWSVVDYVSYMINQNAIDKLWSESRSKGR